MVRDNSIDVDYVVHRAGSELKKSQSKLKEQMKLTKKAVKRENEKNAANEKRLSVIEQRLDAIEAADLDGRLRKIENKCALSQSEYRSALPVDPQTGCTVIGRRVQKQFSKE